VQQQQAAAATRAAGAVSLASVTVRQADQLVGERGVVRPRAPRGGGAGLGLIGRDFGCKLRICADDALCPIVLIVIDSIPMFFASSYKLIII
jgi:hypothetical protein